MFIESKFRNRVNRLPYMKYLVERWKGPFSIAIFLLDSEIDIVDDWLNQYKHLPNLRVTFYIVDSNYNRVQYDVVYWKRGNVLRNFRQYKRIYPINVLRDVAILNTVTTHYINLDMDLWPSCWHLNTLIPIRYNVRESETTQCIDSQ